MDTDEHYVDDMLDQMERGELNHDNILYKDRNFVSQTSKQFFYFSRRLRRQASDVSIGRISDTSNESTPLSEEQSPLDDDFNECDNIECFNWDVSKHNYDAKTDDTKLSQFYSEYKPDVNLFSSPKIKAAKPEQNKNVSNENKSINSISRIKPKYHSFKETVNNYKYNA